MQYHVKDYLTDRAYTVSDTENGYLVADASGKSHALDTSSFTKKEDGFYADDATLRSAMQKSSIGAPKGYVPLRNTLSAAGVNVGYSEKSDAPIVNGHLLNKNDKRLVKVGDTYYMDKNFAAEFMPKPYINPYNAETKTLLSELINSRFSYHPNQDNALRIAQENAMLRAKQSANSRGLLGGSTAEIMRQRAAQDLIPQYEQLAYARYKDNVDAKIRTLSLLDALSENAFREYEGEETLRLKEQTLAQEAESASQAADVQAAAKQADAYRQALDRVKLLGEVDQEAAEILKLPVGTLTEDRRQFLESFSQLLQKMAQEASYTQAQREQDFQNEKDLAAQKHIYDLENIYAKG